MNARTENVAMATKYFGVPLILLHKCAKFYLILTRNVKMTFDLDTE